MARLANRARQEARRMAPRPPKPGILPIKSANDKAVKNLEMSVRSARAVEKLCEIVLAMHKGDMDEARNSDPRFWVGSIMAPSGMSTLMADAKAGRYTLLPWSEWMRLWSSNRLQNQTKDLIAVLPTEVRSKYE